MTDDLSEGIIIKVAGLDIGSRTIKLVILENKKLSTFEIVDTGYDPIAICKRLLRKHNFENIIATGYGRHMAKMQFADAIITEIKAYSVGAKYLFPKCKTIIDVGGQDSKVIRISENGQLEDFEMNDRCAAGTGRFLEVISKALGFTIDEFGEQALKAKRPVNINSMCTVFAESEVISLIAKGENRKNIALGVHQAIVTRLLTMLYRMGVKEDVVFAGGVAKNRCITHLLEKKLRVKLFIPREPQIVGALGAALCAE